MVDEREPIKNFNIQTMSGIYPGSRTMVYQRLRLRDHNSNTGQWYQLQWYSDPTSAVLFSIEENQPTTTARITLTEPQPSTFVAQLHEALSQTGQQADACFACRHWQALNVHTTDGIPAGRCRWRDANAELPTEIATQSALSLACEHFERSEQAPSAPAAANIPQPNPLRVPKSAELDPDRLPFWSRLWHRLRHGNKPTQDWASDILERSGVGAGTEPCFICQGRLANLGAIAVASQEGDKQTFSVWRCRSCYTTYLNDWTDRWERLESLETEELYFRVAPSEAYAALRIIHATKGGEHPGRREDRHQQREEILLLVAKKIPLSHQVRQGR